MPAARVLGSLSTPANSFRPQVNYHRPSRAWLHQAHPQSTLPLAIFSLEQPMIVLHSACYKHLRGCLQVYLFSVWIAL